MHFDPALIEETRIRFETFIEKDPKITFEGTECWLWTGTLCRDGYGHFWFDGAKHKAHRIAWRLWRGKVRSDREIDHRCQVRRCVNPFHSQQVTGLKNKQLMHKRRAA